MATKRIIVAVILVLIAACVTYRLEHRLTPEIRNWYRWHSVLMDTKCPWTKDGKTEGFLFLRMGPAQQRVYIANFWAYRMPGLRQIYTNRIAVVRGMFRIERPGHEHMTDRGQLVLLAGYPDITTTLNSYGEMGSEFDREVWQEWNYLSGSLDIRYYFKFTYPTEWRTEPAQLEFRSEQRLFENRCRGEFAPTTDGWDAINALSGEGAA